MTSKDQSFLRSFFAVRKTENAETAIDSPRMRPYAMSGQRTPSPLVKRRTEEKRDQKVRKIMSISSEFL